jgi:outer membrane receptor for Fe3+-dicitrate
VIDENKKIGMIMKYPTLGSVDPSMDFTKEQTNKIFQLIGNSIYQIYEGDKIYNTTDYTKEELNKFIESLSTKAFGDIQNFYNTMPKLIHEVEIENPKTKVKSKVTLQGLTDFFG